MTLRSNPARAGSFRTGNAGPVTGTPDAAGNPQETAPDKNKPEARIFKPCRWTLYAQSRYYSRPNTHP